ncbi:MULTISPECIES: hypothetical protein [Pandoraea]|uniref:hypothetical protein n=1 Tax=Pandoraea TaxID=93217 RepID=UPI001F5CA5FE|nr:MULTISPECIES: hypothetical protein [Pandoraea]MCI3206425.1 hypothetical protein [Pandoraea sp. LA3]MDN4584453.1 hypothetical protein [Pandoraea capi]
MSFFELSTAGAMLAKAKRELERLEAEESIDHVYNLFTTAYHVTDYLKPVLSDADHRAVLNDAVMKHCADVCNKAKHMTLTRGRPDPSTYEISGAIGGAALNSIALNASGGRWVRWDDGTELEVVQFAKSVIARLEQIFAQHAIATNA